MREPTHVRTENRRERIGARCICGLVNVDRSTHTIGRRRYCTDCGGLV